MRQGDRVLRHGAEVLVVVGGVFVGWIGAGGAGGVARLDAPADHLRGAGIRRREQRCVNMIASRHVRRDAIVFHHGVGFGGVHDLVIEFDGVGGGERVDGRDHLGGDGDRRAVGGTRGPRGD